LSLKERLKDLSKKMKAENNDPELERQFNEVASFIQRLTEERELLTKN
jgi:hypothetical protein